MYIGCISCNGKCCIEAGVPVTVCINDQWKTCDTTVVDDDLVIQEYLQDPITEAIIFAGLEPFEQFPEMFAFIQKLREKYECNDDVVIYTGYNKTEISSMISSLIPLKNIVVKFGRFIPNQNKHFDEVLGVSLASDNQYAEVIC